MTNEERKQLFELYQTYGWNRAAVRFYKAHGYIFRPADIAWELHKMVRLGDAPA